MATDASVHVRIALLSHEPAQRRRLASLLEARGIEVVTECRLSGFSRALARGADALLVDLHDACDEELDALDRIADERSEPMVFMDSAVVDARVLTRTAEKLRAAVVESRQAAARAEGAVVEGTTPVSDCQRFPVWVLAASFGGPETLRRFLAALPAAPNAAFIIAQHIGDGFADVLAQQLHRCGPTTVVPAAQGLRIGPGRAYVAPIRERLDIDEDGRFRLMRDPGAEQVYAPCIDRIMQSVAGRYRDRSGAIVFTGMGDDSRRGCLLIDAAGGRVWCQSPETALVDSMPRHALSTGVIARQGTPEALARELVGELQQASTATRDDKTA